jgi:hypothetical protein
MTLIPAKVLNVHELYNGYLVTFRLGAIILPESPIGFNLEKTSLAAVGLILFSSTIPT